MKSVGKKNGTDPISEKTDSIEADDSFHKLMKHNGVIPLDSVQEKKSGRCSPLLEIEPVDFDDSFDWEQEIAAIPPAAKFSGHPGQSRRRPAKKLKISRKFSPDFILDLHGETRESALARVRNSIRISDSGGYRALLIITGKGINSKEKGGVLGKAVWDWLKHYQVKRPIRFQWAPPFLGGKGAILVFF